MKSFVRVVCWYVYIIDRKCEKSMTKQPRFMEQRLRKNKDNQIP